MRRRAETATYTGTDPVKDALSLNLHRRHLSESQRAMIAAKLANIEIGENQHSGASANLQTLVSQSSAAEQLNVSTRSVASAKKVLTESPELAEQIAAAKKEVRMLSGIRHENLNSTPHFL